MSSFKRKKTRRNHKKKTSEKIVEAMQTDSAGNSKKEVTIKYVLYGLFLIYLFYYFFNLYTSLDKTFFWADENKHAYISSLVLKNHQIPVVLPAEMYGEFQWSYPPLFHIIGAAVQGLAGFTALKYTNLILFLVFILFFFIMTYKYYGDTEAILACLLLSLAPVVAVNTIRFTVEMLSMLLTFLSFFFFLLALRENKTHFAVFCGLSTALLMLSKQTGFIVLSFYFLLLPWLFWKNKSELKILLSIIAVSLGIYLPYFIWATSHEAGIFSFINLFIGKRPEWALLGAKSFQRYDSALTEFGLLYYEGAGFVVTLSILLPLYYFIRTRLKDTPQIYILLLGLYLSAVMVVWHITNSRHIITLIPFIVFLFSYSLHQIVTRKRILQSLCILLLIIAGYSAYRIPDYRQKYNKSGKEFMPIAKIIKEDNYSSGRILCANKFDALMYTQKPVIWPHPKLNKNPLDLFERQSPENLYSILKSYQIKYVLINVSLVTNTGRFMGRNYPLFLVRNFEHLERQGKLTLKGISESKKFILLKVS